MSRKEILAAQVQTLQLLPLLPFFLAGLLPFLVGTLLAAASGFPLRWPVLVAGVNAVGALIAAAFASREVFAPGAGRCPGLTFLSPVQAGRLAAGSLALAAGMGLLLQFWWRTGEFTILLGGLGALGGYFSFAPPLRWHQRGWGKITGALCYGLLPLAAGLYLQCGHMLLEVALFGLPLTAVAYNLFLIYGLEVPQEGNAGGRRGAGAALAYTLCNILTIAGLVAIIFFPASALPWRGALWPLLILAAVNQELVKRGAWRQPARIDLLCRLTLALHLGMGLVFVLMLWLRL